MPVAKEGRGRDLCRHLTGIVALLHELAEPLCPLPFEFFRWKRRMQRDVGDQIEQRAKFLLSERPVMVVASIELPVPSEPPSCAT